MAKPGRKRRNNPRRNLGTTPGTVIYTGVERTDQVTLNLIEYDEEIVKNDNVRSLSGLNQRMEGATVSWLNVAGVHETEVIEDIGRHLNIHPMIQEDIANVEHLPKAESFADHLFFTLKMISLSPESQSVEVEHLSFILGRAYLVSFQEKQGDVFNPIRDRINASAGRVRKKHADYLFYLLLDAVIDNYLFVLQDLKDKTVSMEEALIQNPGVDRINDIFEMKREADSLRKLIFPLKEAISRLTREEGELIEEINRQYFSDLVDHMHNVSEMFEDLREAISGLSELNMANVNNSMNKVMKTLTIIATIFIPLTFIAGIYGMNFQHMPELSSPYGYPIALGTMAIIGLGLFLIMKIRGWF